MAHHKNTLHNTKYMMDAILSWSKIFHSVMFEPWETGHGFTSFGKFEPMRVHCMLLRHQCLV